MTIEFWVSTVTFGLFETKHFLCVLRDASGKVIKDKEGGDDVETKMFFVDELFVLRQITCGMKHLQKVNVKKRPSQDWVDAIDSQEPPS